jgi:uroporphyrinogen-III decarboxylase
MPGVNFDLNAYCIGHITRNGTDIRSDSNLLALPEGFVTEAQALGASINQTSGGFVVPSFLYTDPAMLSAIPRIDKQSPIKLILEKIQHEKHRPIILKVSGPYSILASVVEPSLFYRWLKKNRFEVHAALQRITSGLTEYIVQALANGAKIISLADPYANPSILGESIYKEYAGSYLIKLLHAILDQPLYGLVHICPHSSIPLEQFGYTVSEAVAANNTISYIDTLLELVKPEKIIVTGHQCIYSNTVSNVQQLRLSPDPAANPALF